MKGRLHSFDHQFGGNRLTYKQPPMGTDSRRSNRDLFPCVVNLTFSWDKTPLNKLVLCNPDADASVTVGLQFLSHDRAFDCRDHAFDRSIQKPHDKTDGRRKLHSSGETQVETGRANVV